MLAPVLCTVYQAALCANCENSVKHLLQSDLQVRKGKGSSARPIRTVSAQLVL